MSERLIQKASTLRKPKRSSLLSLPEGRRLPYPRVSVPLASDTLVPRLFSNDTRRRSHRCVLPSRPFRLSPTVRTLSRVSSFTALPSFIFPRDGVTTISIVTFPSIVLSLSPSLTLPLFRDFSIHRSSRIASTLPYNLLTSPLPFLTVFRNSFISYSTIFVTSTNRILSPLPRHALLNVFRQR